MSQSYNIQHNCRDATRMHRQNPDAPFTQGRPYPRNWNSQGGETKPESPTMATSLQADIHGNAQLV